MRSLGGARGKQEAGSPEEDTAAAEARETRRASTARAVLATSDANVAKSAIVKREAKREAWILLCWGHHIAEITPDPYVVVWQEDALGWEEDHYFGTLFVVSRSRG